MIITSNKIMHKNRRNTLSPFTNISLQSKYSPDKCYLHYHDKQNQAKLVLLDLGNDDTMFQIDNVLAEQNPSRNSLIQQMKAHQNQLLCQKSHQKNTSAHSIHALLPIDSNCNFQANNFLEDKPPPNTGKKQRFSLRNTPFTKSKQNLFPFRQDIQNKKEQKTILNLKKILKKLQSPQKTKQQLSIDNHQASEDIKKRKKSVNKVTQFCNQFLYRSILYKDRTQNDLISHQKSAQSPIDFQPQKVKFYEFRSCSKTSHQKHRSSLGRTQGTHTPMSFYYKSTKLTNKQMLLKRNSVTSGDLTSQKSNIPTIRKASARIVQHASKPNVDRRQCGQIFSQNEKMRQERKSRNLKNILFD